MKALIIGCGRVGSNVALQLDREGWDVTAVDEKEEAIGRLGDHWTGGFVQASRTRTLWSSPPTATTRTS